MSNNFSKNHQSSGEGKVLTQVRPKFQITIPATLRDALDIKIGDIVEIVLQDNEALVLKPKRVVKKINKKNN